jgi:TolB-like protein
VFDLENGGVLAGEPEDLATLGKGLASVIADALREDPRVSVIERGHIATIVAEHKRTIGGAIDEATATQIGRMVGAHHMVFGVLMKEKSDLHVSVRVVDVETGRTCAPAAPGKYARDRIVEGLRDLGRRLFACVQLAPPPPAAAQPAIPARALLLFSTGLSHEDRGDRAAAIEAYRAALEVFPGYRAAAERLAKLGGG